MHFFAKYVFFSKVMACLFHLLPRKTKKKHQHTQPTNIDLFAEGGEAEKRLGSIKFCCTNQCIWVGGEKNGGVVSGAKNAVR